MSGKFELKDEAGNVRIQAPAYCHLSVYTQDHALSRRFCRLLPKNISLQALSSPEIAIEDVLHTHRIYVCLVKVPQRCVE